MAAEGRRPATRGGRTTSSESCRRRLIGALGKSSSVRSILDAFETRGAEGKMTVRDDSFPVSSNNAKGMWGVGTCFRPKVRSSVLQPTTLERARIDFEL